MALLWYRVPIHWASVSAFTLVPNLRKLLLSITKEMNKPMGKTTDMARNALHPKTQQSRD